MIMRPYIPVSSSNAKSSCFSFTQKKGEKKPKLNGAEKAEK
jgi:hypothetical protein